MKTNIKLTPTPESLGNRYVTSEDVEIGISFIGNWNGKDHFEGSDGNVYDSDGISMTPNGRVVSIIREEVARQEKNFPNGFTSWMETHHDLVSWINTELMRDYPSGLIEEVMSTKGRGGMYELAEELTDRFEKMHEGYEWDGDYFDTIEEFMDDMNGLNIEQFKKMIA
jgi:hypothetical protein